VRTLEAGEPSVLQGASTPSQLTTLLRRSLRWAEVDRAVIYGVLASVRSVVAGPITAVLIALYFTPVLQGYYYTFSGLLTLQIFVDLGLGYTIIQFASHEWASLGLDGNGRIVGSPEMLSRLVSLGRVAFRWYAVAGGILAVGLGLAGSLFFSQPPDRGIAWVVPWLALCVLAGINLCLTPVWSLLEGCNQVSQVNAYRLVQGVANSLAIWSAIALGAELWTGVVATAVTLVWSGIFLRCRYAEFFRPFFSPPVGSRISWRLEIWPLQWKIGLSWLSGYFTFYLFTPILFHYHGPVAAGQMGMTWSVVFVLFVMSSTWVSTRVPRFGMLIARRAYADLDRLFLRLTIASFSVAVCGAVFIWGGVYLLYASHHPLALRVLPPLPVGLFLAAMVLTQISSSQAAYLRAHKQEPFLWLSIASGILTGLSTWLLGRRFGVIGMAAGFLGVTAAVVIPVGTIIWWRCRAAWHDDGTSGLGHADRGCPETASTLGGK
jgi:O-antigen/teichoic acid export membrane protein